jgi:hypothetical protein
VALERIAFILDETAERFDALVNPDTVRLRRRSGLRTLPDRPGSIAGAGGSDDVIVATAGGRTEIELDLLFDVELMGSRGPRRGGRRPVSDVRLLSGPLWSLSENRHPSGPPHCRLVWGKHLDVPVVVEAVSERLERFDAAGVPSRSYLSLRLVRTAADTGRSQRRSRAPAPQPISTAQTTPRAPRQGQPGPVFHEVVGRQAGTGGPRPGPPGERIDDLATRYYGDPALWRQLALVNELDDLPWVPPGQVLVVPPIDRLAPARGPGGSGPARAVAPVDRPPEPA